MIEWGAGVEQALGYGFPPSPVEPTVQGARPEVTEPERYAGDQERYELLDRAVRRVGDIDLRWKGVLWQVYAQGRIDEGHMADELGVPTSTWRRWRRAAMEAFLRAYQGLDVGELATQNRDWGRGAP